MKVIVVAGTHSGVGKTSLATGLMHALRCAATAVSQYCCCKQQNASAEVVNGSIFLQHSLTIRTFLL
jgi:dethiobiotin synthetase